MGVPLLSREAVSSNSHTIEVGPIFFKFLYYPVSQLHQPQQPSLPTLLPFHILLAVPLIVNMTIMENWLFS